MKKLVLIDGNAIIHRAYHAMPALTTPMGAPIGAVQGFLNMILKIIEDMNPTHIAVAWDRPEPTFRNKLFKEYQSQRPEVDKELIGQFEKVRQALDAFGIVQYDKEGFEADDIIGTLSVKAFQSGSVIELKSKRKIKSSTHLLSRSLAPIGEVIIVTGDKDQLQLVTDRVKVYLPLKGLSIGQIMDAKAVKEKMGVTPPQVIDLKGFMGDSSDNYPGVRGIGPKTAQKLLDTYETYPNVYKHIDEIEKDNSNLAKKLEEGKELGDMSYKLARIVTDVDVPFEPEKLDKWSIGNDETIEVFNTFGFKSLTKRVIEIRERLEMEKQGKLF